MQRIRIDDAVIERARARDPAAVDGMVRALQGPFFDLARRMVLDSGDAEDAAQEALLPVVTHLAQFDRRARFSTWASADGAERLPGRARPTLPAARCSPRKRSAPIWRTGSTRTRRSDRMTPRCSQR